MGQMKNDKIQYLKLTGCWKTERQTMRGVSVCQIMCQNWAPVEGLG
jgi:hypothetical protein